MTTQADGTVVFHAGALGDSVLTWPLLRGLVQRGPVTLAASPARARLASEAIEGVRAMDGGSPELSRLFAPRADVEIGERVSEMLGGTGRVISYVSDGEDVWAENLARIAPDAEHYFVRTHADGENVMHITIDQRRQLEKQGLPVELIDPEPRGPVDGPVVVHPGSGSREKCWPAECFDRLLKHFEMIGRPVVVVLGEVELEKGLGHAETPTAAAAWINRWKYRHDIAEPPTVLDLARTIRQASVYIGNDSGPTHLAAQLGVPTIGLYGPTDPRIWAPQGPAVRTLWPGDISDMDWLEVETVIEAAARF